MATVKSYENKCATNYSIITNNKWNDVNNNMQLTKHDTNDDVDTMHLHFNGRVAYMRIFVPQLVMTPHTSGLKSWALSHSHPRSYSWRVLLDSPSSFFFYLFLLSFSVFLFHLELFLELTYTKSMANLRCSAAEESEDTLNVFHSHTHVKGIIRKVFLIQKRRVIVIQKNSRKWR